ncbi:CpsD/CapB family tyrosine-protein kinase [Sulfitobacter sediminilitoris]|uniref:CpsD/CapB family tyrosine-protein kinase n=1 Tax=Sulfitobacter sediminilitoris TaxID=2698830 RepID=UPI002E2B4AD4|nr:CpsD/CapB family tyrosine-protein kinase [Sulfitobacter sediminilitoris]
MPAIPARRRKNVLKYFVDKPTSAAAEAIRNLRTSVLLSNIDNPPKVIMSTSSIPQEGKTTQSMALALNLTGLGKRVLLIEGDIRRRIFSQYFELPNTNGLLSVLAGNLSLQDAVIRIDALGADVLIGEKAKTIAADIFSSERFAMLLETAREQYDYIIIDTPPVLAVPDARIIGRHVDAIIYTVKWDSTSHRQVREGLKAFEDVNLRVSGLVLGQINARGMKRYGYGDSYGAYHAYYAN